MPTLLARLEAAQKLDGAADALRRLARKTWGRPGLADLLHRRLIGHPVHPAVVHLPIGAWMSTAVLDALPGTEHAATTLLAVGTAGAVPAAATGLSEYVTLTRPQRRVALAHFTANGVAMGFFAASIAARLRGDHARGRVLSYTGLGVAGISAYLGGHIAYAMHGPAAAADGQSGTVDYPSMS
ncbi:DUF2231 domain-containing protein [Dactylosporangium sp. CS-047395]|uniref:DUF2231 domain-containing protein n=1 Tax=Dactylosporangium sp. CS-047395 TaxID=3239936 RepID=UPI003D912C6C